MCLFARAIRVCHSPRDLNATERARRSTLSLLLKVFTRLMALNDISFTFITKAFSGYSFGKDGPK